MIRRLAPVLLGLAGCAAHVHPRDLSAPPPAGGTVRATVFLIGDAGAPRKGGEPVLQALLQELAHRPDSTVVLFLGDNVYPNGMPDSADATWPEARRRLLEQVAIARVVPVIFLPGNHDWNKSGPRGWERIRAQGRMIAEEGGGRARLLPVDGCPGPVVVDVGPGLRLILLDTEWWLFPGEKPGAASPCDAGTPEAVRQRLGMELAGSAGRQVIVAGHHPLLSSGPHGGFFSPVDFLFPLRNLHPMLYLPLPLIGTIYPVGRGMGVSDEDLSGAGNVRMRAAFDSAFACRPPALYASGHEHGLQLLDRGHPPLLAVSGAGIYGHTEYLQRIPETRLALAESGFMRADLLADGRLRLGVLTVNRAGTAREVYATVLPPPGGEGEGRCRS